MSLPVNNKKEIKFGNKAAKGGAVNNSKFLSKPGKAVGAAKKPIKTGGSRGS